MEPSEFRCVRCGRPMDVVRLRCEECELDVEGRFDVPPLARLSLEEQAFVTAFVRAHGNMRKMEGLFGISYPTVKKRLNEITQKLDAAFEAPRPPGVVLDRLARGEISVQEALELLSRRQ